MDEVVKQEGSIDDMMFSVGAIIAYVTEFMTFELSDLIATITAPVVEPMLLRSAVGVEFDGIGVLENRVLA